MNPYSNWDLTLIAQWLICVLLVLLFFSLAAISEGGSWSDPYFYIFDFVKANEFLFIASFMILLMALWWYESFRGGYV